VTGRDAHFPADANLEAIADALKRRGNKDYAVKKLPDLNHFFQTAGTGAPSEYLTIEETLVPSALDTITNWISDHVK
jgi:hypothetical protein